MELKRVLGTDSRSATAKAIELYGRDALIISNERVNGKVEVIVAVELGRDRVNPPAKLEPKSDSPEARFQEMPMLAPSGDGARFGALLQGQLGELQTPVKFAGGPQMPVRADAERQELDRAKDLVEMLRGEFAEMRKDLRIARQVGVWQLSHGLTDAVKPLASALAEAGAPAAIRSLLIDEFKDMDSLAEAFSTVAASLKQTIRRTPSSSPLAGVHVIAGPSGAGKSMMVGRVAAMHVRARVYDPDDIAVISFCDQRPGAWGQLQLLCAKVGVECHRAKDAAMLKELNRELGSKSMVLIDTPGVRVFEHLQAIAAVTPLARLHLLLPLDASAATFKRFLDHTDLKWESLMLSKLDEAVHSWPLIQALCEHALPLSFASRGPAIDEPVDAPDTDVLVDMALGSLALFPGPAALVDENLTANKFAVDPPEFPVRRRAIKALT